MQTTPSAVSIAVIDVETTGLFPLRHDRVVEVAAILVDSGGGILREFSSLVNPDRDIGPSSIHGLTAEDVILAPQFSEIAGLLVEALQGAVAIAGHNVRFDHQFLMSEFSRIRCPMPECATVCTMRLAGGGRLADCCCDYGVAFDGRAHHALADARATARLLGTLLADEPDLARQLSRLSPIRWPPTPVGSRRPVTRDESRKRRSEHPTFLQRLRDRLPPGAYSAESDGAVMAYEALLDRVLEDRRIDDVESDALVEVAVKWGLRREQIELAHREYLNRLAVAAVSDGVVTAAERRDLALVARLLGQEIDGLDGVLQDAVDKIASVSTPPSIGSAAPADLVGKRICFTGELQCRVGSEPISRSDAHELATKAGAIVEESVTKRLDLLVLVDPHSQSGKAKKARKYGIRIMQELVFWKTLGIEVD